MWRKLFSRHFLSIMALALFLALNPGSDTFISAAPQKKTSSSGKKSGSKKSAGKKSSSSKGKTAKKAVNKNSSQAAPAVPKTSNEARRQQEATNKEIQLTEAQIKENDKAVKQGLSELGKLEGEINESKNKIKGISQKIGDLTSRITVLETNISGNEAELEKLRGEYLKAVKKMRLAKKSNSELAFIFSSENFNQAVRRMRYLKQFSEWKDRQSNAIESKISELKTQKESLAKAKVEYDAALSSQQTEQNKLESQFSRQDALVAQLKQNGEALQTHLAKKQAEANELRNRISSLIAAEQKKAEEERLRQEQERRAAEERKAREEQAQREREENERLEKEKEQQLAMAAEDKSETKQSSDKAAKKSDKKSTVSKEEKKKEEKKQSESSKENKKDNKKDNKIDNKKETKQETSSVNYADARKRTPRGSSGKTNDKTVASPTISGSDFASMKGSLPRPASGSFKVTSRFGRQALPDLPDVVYDNPGIDAEVASGSSALAVFNGKVSGVYMLPGYNTVVIVNHGNYYTVYGNISSPAVKVGDAVKAGQGLGKLAPDEDDNSHSSIHFEVWKNRDKLNPLEWIR